MPVSDKNQQIAVVIPKTMVKKLDKLADKDIRTRSQAAAKIIIDYLNTIED